VKNSMIEELGDQPSFICYFNHFYIFCTTISTPFLLLLLLLIFIVCREILNTDILISLLYSLGDYLRSSDHNYTIISLALYGSTLESYLT